MPDVFMRQNEGGMQQPLDMGKYVVAKTLYSRKGMCIIAEKRRGCSKSGRHVLVNDQGS
jgi:hypothetical protein